MTRLLTSRLWLLRLCIVGYVLSLVIAVHFHPERVFPYGIASWFGGVFFILSLLLHLNLIRLPAPRT